MGINLSSEQDEDGRINCRLKSAEIPESLLKIFLFWPNCQSEDEVEPGGLTRLLFYGLLNLSHICTRSQVTEFSTTLKQQQQQQHQNTPVSQKHQLTDKTLQYNKFVKGAWSHRNLIHFYKLWPLTCWLHHGDLFHCTK